MAGGRGGYAQVRRPYGLLMQFPGHTTRHHGSWGLQAPKICTDPSGVNRVAAHRQINVDALAFFRGTLHVLPQTSSK